MAAPPPEPEVLRVRGAFEVGDPTPWMGLIERAMYGGWLLWMAALSIVLLRTDDDPMGRTGRGTLFRRGRRPAVAPG